MSASDVSVEQSTPFCGVLGPYDLFVPRVVFRRFPPRLVPEHWHDNPRTSESSLPVGSPKSELRVHGDRGPIVFDACSHVKTLKKSSFWSM